MHRGAVFITWGTNDSNTAQTAGESIDHTRWIDSS